MIETVRLQIRWLMPQDASWILALLNQPGWLRYIGNKKVHSLADAETYLLQGPMQSYEEHGFGLYAVQLRESGLPVGICGLIKRPTLEDVDLGFALLEQAEGQGYALEAATAVLEYGYGRLGLQRVVAITTVDNERSQRLLHKLAFQWETRLSATAEAPELEVFAHQA